MAAQLILTNGRATAGWPRGSVGHQFLAGSVLALNQDVRLARRHRRHQIEHRGITRLRPTMRRLPPHPRAASEPRVLGLQVLVRRRPADEGEDALGLGRLLKEIGRAPAHGGHRPRRVALGDQHDDVGLGLERGEPPTSPIGIGIGDSRSMTAASAGQAASASSDRSPGPSRHTRSPRDRRAARASRSSTHRRG